MLHLLLAAHLDAVYPVRRENRLCRLVNIDVLRRCLVSHVWHYRQRVLKLHIQIHLLLQ